MARAHSQERTREALQEAAVQEFYAGRWEKTSLDALADSAGVTKQTLLRHFGSKAGLLLQAIVQNAAKGLDQRRGVPQGDIAGAVDNVLEHYEEWGSRSLRIGAWLEGGNPMLVKISQAARQVHYDWVEYAFAPQLKRLQGQERVRTRAALIALCDVHTWWLLSHDLGFERAQVRATLITAIEGLLSVVASEEA